MSQGVDCYDYNGDVYSNNTHCPGSSVCCLTADECTNNRLCEKSDGELIRPVCAVYPWVDECSQICLYHKSDGFLPRVSICSDGSVCCDDNPQCCIDHEGIILDGSGQVVSTEGSASPTSTLTTSSIPSTTSTIITTPVSSTDTATTTNLTVPSATSANQAHTSSTNLSAGTIAGIVIGSVIALLLLIAVVLLWRRRSYVSVPKSDRDHTEDLGQDPFPLPDYSEPQEMRADKPAHTIPELENRPLQPLELAT